MGPGPIEKRSRSCPLPGDLPEPPPSREPSPPAASWTLGRPGWLFSPRAEGSVDGVAPGGAGGPSCASYTMCFVCFSLPRSRFPLCGGRRDYKGLTHIFNPPPKSKWPVWCLRSARRPLAPVHPCVLLSCPPVLLFPHLCFGAAVWGNALLSSSVPHAQSSGRPRIPAPSPPVGNILGNQVFPNRM